MPFLRPSLPELIDRIQADLTTRLALGGAVVRRSVIAVLARVEAAATHGLHGHLEFLADQILPDTSEVEFLERQAGLYGLSRVAATYAAGDVVFTGVDGSVIPSGTSLQRGDGVEYTTDASGTIASGEATIAVTALLAGENGNADAAVSLALIAPIAGVAAAAAVDTGGLLGGTDPETDDALRARVIARMQQPPHGGAAADYVAWAIEAGASRAWVYPQELGPGTVTVRFVRDGDVDGLIPLVDDVTDVQDYIDERRPVTADVTVVAPTAAPMAVTLHVVPDTAETRVAVVAELEDLLRRTAEPGGTILVSQVRLAVGVAEGVDDFSVATPAADVTHTTGQIATMGTVTWT